MQDAQINTHLLMHLLIVGIPVIITYQRVCEQLVLVGLQTYSCTLESPAFLVGEVFCNTAKNLSSLFSPGSFLQYGCKFIKLGEPLQKA